MKDRTKEKDPFTYYMYHTIPHFDALKLWKTLLEKEILLVISNFTISHNVSTLYGTHFPLQMHIKMPSAICFNLDQSKILSSGNRLALSHTATFTLFQTE